MSYRIRRSLTQDSFHGEEAVFNEYSTHETFDEDKGIYPYLLNNGLELVLSFEESTQKALDAFINGGHLDHLQIHEDYRKELEAEGYSPEDDGYICGGNASEYFEERFVIDELTRDRVARPPEQIMECVIDEHHGIYCPQVFAERFGEYLGDEDEKILAAGPNDYLDEYADDLGHWSDIYWSVWDRTLSNFKAEHPGFPSGECIATQDGDVFLIDADCTELEHDIMHP